MSIEEKSYKIWTAGLNYILIDFGLEKNIEYNIKSIILKDLLIEAGVKGITEMVPSNSSLMVGYEPDLIKTKDLENIIIELVDDIEKRENLVVPSRLIEIPVLFDDPWTRECVENYCKRVKPIQNNIDKILEANGLRDLEELKYYYTFPQFWVCYVGFWPGLASALCLDPRFNLSVEKYNPPRTTTPKGAIGLGGTNTSIYPMDSPGGFQLWGITPVPIYDSNRKLEVFKDSMVLFRVTDRIKFRAIDMEEFMEIKRQVEEGTYVYNIIDYELFDSNAYKKFLDSCEKQGGGASV